MGKSCWRASLAIQLLFPIQILLILPGIKELPNFIFQCYRHQTWHIVSCSFHFWYSQSVRVTWPLATKGLSATRNMPNDVTTQQQLQRSFCEALTSPTSTALIVDEENDSPLEFAVKKQIKCDDQKEELYQNHSNEQTCINPATSWNTQSLSVYSSQKLIKGPLRLTHELVERGERTSNACW